MDKPESSSVVQEYNYTDGVKWYTSPFNSQKGRFVAYGFEFPDGSEHFAMVKGDLGTVDVPLVRVQSSCITGTAFLAHLCDCRQQLHMAMEVVQQEEAGLVLYLDQEGRAHGLVEKLAQLSLINSGMDTLDAAITRGFGPDLRTYEQAAWMIRHLVGGDRPIRLLSNNPTKIGGLRDEGIEVVEDLRLETQPTATNFSYLRVKRDRMGHILPSLAEPQDLAKAAAGS